MFNAVRVKPRRWPLVLGVLVLIAVGLVGAALYQWDAPMGRGSGLVEFKLTPNSRADEIGRELANIGLVRSAGWFTLWARLSGREARFVAGTYHLPYNSSVITLTRLLTGAVTPTDEVAVRLTEGWTLVQMDKYLAQQGVYAAGEFARAAKDSAKVRELSTVCQPKLLGELPVGATLEGYLFPDTYRIYRSSAPQELIGKMLTEYCQAMSELMPGIERERRAVREVVILASIVEREVAGAADRALVTDIFWRRLKVGQALQADSTVNYVTGKNTPALSAEDIKLASPYNTYQHRGLPPGPISNPSRVSLAAAVYPQSNQYWYFLTTADGKVIYSKTYTEHLAAKRRYLR